MKYCHKCLTEWEGIGQPGMRDVCHKCRADLHACFNCKHYDTSKSNQCYANIEEPVIYKDRSNFCEEFTFFERKSPPKNSSGLDPVRAREAFDNIFNKKFT